MANRSSIAVIIPAYNSVKYLEETLHSALSQTLAPEEVLVVDDGSSDGTPELAESHGPPVRVFRRSHQRQAASRNFAATQTNCEWLAFLDHDDLWQPNKLELQMKELKRRPEADLCYSARMTFKEDENGVLREGASYNVPPPDRIREALFVNTTFLPGSVLIRRSAYLAAGGFNPSIKLVEDWDLWLRLLQAKVQFAGCNEPLLLTRHHAGNLSNNAIAALAEQKEIYRRLVLPHLPRHSQWLTHQRSQSRQETVAAFILRQNGDPRHFAMMARAILRYPFTDPHRYKVFAHMIYTRLGMGRKTSSDNFRSNAGPS
jgi:glycosyltransferase involved in cell wall biosynthesis